MGVRLPENFDSPYLKSSLTAFWNSWHITLAQWFRAYYFNPLTRFMRTHLRRVPAWLIILTGQLTTMFLIGIWHGLTWNFAIWGAWHGAGLFINNRWSELTRSRLGSAGERRTLQMALRFGGWFLTFNYVALGWVWFALPSPQMSLDVLRVLTGQ
jgi:alginate O-acetyltransferase complex protein AlgI